MGSFGLSTQYVHCTLVDFKINTDDFKLNFVDFRLNMYTALGWISAQYCGGAEHTDLQLYSHSSLQCL